MSRKFALIIGNSHYDDPHFDQLKTPDADVKGLAAVLRDPDIGGFDSVQEVINQPVEVVKYAIIDFFYKRQIDDLLLLYFSGHGLTDNQGHLYLGVKDTSHELRFLKATAIEASFIRDDMDECRSKRQILILDCCYSGAFPKGAKKGKAKAVTRETFIGNRNGYGRIVLTASDSTQYAWDGDQLDNPVEHSLFTHFLIRGLTSGKADSNRDGKITVSEWYDYTYDQVIKQTYEQTPQKWAYGQEGDLVIANSPIQDTQELVESGSKPKINQLFYMIPTGIGLVILMIIIVLGYIPLVSFIAQANPFTGNKSLTQGPATITASTTTSTDIASTDIAFSTAVTSGNIVPNTATTVTPTASATTTSKPTSTSTPPTPTATLPAPTFTATLPPATPTNLPNAILVSNSLNLRAGPATNYSIITTYSKGEPLKVNGKTQDNTWVNVTTSDGREGWMFVDNLQVNVDLSIVPVLATPPTPTSRPATRTPEPKQIPPTTTAAKPTTAPIVPTTATKPTTAPIVPTTAPTINFNGTWIGTTSVGGTIDFVVSNGRITNIHFAYPNSVEPATEGDCSAVPQGSWAGYESWLNSLRIGIAGNGSFAGRNIPIQSADRVLVEFSGLLDTNGNASGQFQENFPVPGAPSCIHVSAFSWNAKKQ